jgi:hypothetical protein
MDDLPEKIRHPGGEIPFTMPISSKPGDCAAGNAPDAFDLRKSAVRSGSR